MQAYNCGMGETPYYQDEMVTLYHGDCLEVLPELGLSGSVHLLTDPPYYNVKDDDWDNQWSKQADFLDWMGEWLDLATPLLSPDASVWVFASPELTSAVESVVAQRFRILNSVRWVKEQGWHKRAALDSARRFLTPWEGIVLAEQGGAVFQPVRDYLNRCRAEAGLSIADLNRRWQAERGSRGQMAGHWFGDSQWQMPTEGHYTFLANAGLRLRPYHELLREYESLRRPFSITHRDRSTDVFMFQNVAPYPGKHPCEKPAGLLTHMIETTTRPGDTILDPFSGSGAVLEVARHLGRKAVGIEKDAKWVRNAATRLAQPALDIEGMSA